MGKKIYKYVSPRYLQRTLGDDGVATIKCSYPKDFNDPYELFLTVDFSSDPSYLAYYQDVVGELPQHPTTCFSKSPVVAPMWAHYADNLSGFVIEFDEDALTASIEQCGFGDVDYQDTPSDGMEEMLVRAYELQKFRYVAWLQQAVFSAAYYTKATQWSYENERRMIVDIGSIRSDGSLMLLDIPKGCVTAMIAGPRASAEIKQELEERSRLYNCPYFELRIGKTLPVPFMVDSSGGVFTFDGTSIETASGICASCREPREGGDICSWCQINSDHRENAANRNSFRMLHRHGLLDTYLDNVRKIRMEPGADE